jgi:hypothetical protein
MPIEGYHQSRRIAIMSHDVSRMPYRPCLAHITHTTYHCSTTYHTYYISLIHYLLHITYTLHTRVFKRPHPPVIPHPSSRPALLHALHIMHTTYHTYYISYIHSILHRVHTTHTRHTRHTLDHDCILHTQYTTPSLALVQRALLLRALSKAALTWPARPRLA